MVAGKNIDGPARTWRIVAGIILLLLVPLAFVGPKAPLALWGLLGIVPLFAGISGYCIMFGLLGMNSVDRKNAVKQ